MVYHYVIYIFQTTTDESFQSIAEEFLRWPYYGQNIQWIHLTLETAHFLVAFLYKTTKAIELNVATATFLLPYIVIELKCLATPVNPDPSAVMLELYSNCIDDKLSEMKQNFEGSKMSSYNS